MCSRFARVCLYIPDPEFAVYEFSLDVFFPPPVDPYFGTFLPRFAL
jgi:hypothetical protein